MRDVLLRSGLTPHNGGARLVNCRGSRSTSGSGDNTVPRVRHRPVNLAQRRKTRGALRSASCPTSQSEPSGAGNGIGSSTKVGITRARSRGRTATPTSAQAGHCDAAQALEHETLAALQVRFASRYDVFARHDLEEKAGVSIEATPALPVSRRTSSTAVPTSRSR